MVAAALPDLANPTVDEIRDDYLRDLRLEIPPSAASPTGAITNEGSDYWADGVALASVLAPIYANGGVLAKRAFPRSSDEAGLKKLADLWLVPLLGAIFASGTITVQSSFATTIADGTFLTNQSTGQQYKTIGITTIDTSLTGTAFVVARQTGTAGNADAGTALNFDSAPPGINPTATVISISGGDNAWSNARWASEIEKRIQSPPLAGNVAHLYALGNSIPGVEQTFVYPSLRGPGTNDIIITTSATSGSRVAGTALLNAVLGAITTGVKVAGGQLIPALAADVAKNTRVHAAVAQPTNVLIGYKASVNNAFDVWPPIGAAYVTLADPTTWYKVASATSSVSFTVNIPASGTLTPPTLGASIGAFFPSVGFCKGTIATIVGTGPWTITVTGWTSSTGGAPTETTIAVGTVLTPWCSQLPSIAGAPATGSLALSGAVPDYFSGLGPGEMTTLLAADITRRLRWPKTTETSLLTGLALFPTSITSRLAASLATYTDGADFSAAPMSGFSSSPAVPIASYIGTPPSILTLGTVTVIPIP